MTGIGIGMSLYKNPCIMMHQRFIRDNQLESFNKPKMNRKMGYIGNVNDAKEILEKLYKLDTKKNSNS